MPASDLTFDFVNRIIDNPSGTDPLDINVLFSKTKEEFNKSANIQYDFALDSQTNNSLQVINGWYITKRCITLCKGGSIHTQYGTNEITRYDCSTIVANFVAADIGKVIRNTTKSANLGALLDFDNILKQIWVRTTGVRAAVVDDNLDATSGTGNGTSNGTKASGDDLYANIQTITTLTLDIPYPQIMYQMDGQLINSKTFAGAADEDFSNADRGYTDTLIPIREMGHLRGSPSGAIHAYARDAIGIYSDNMASLSNGGVTTLVIETGEDINEIHGSRFICIESIASGVPAIDDIIQATNGTLWDAKIVRYIAGASGYGILEITSSNTPIADNDTIGNGTWTATVRGTIGGQLYSYILNAAGATEPTEERYAEILTFETSNLRAYLRGHITVAEGGTMGYIICESNHDPKANATFYYEAVKDEIVSFYIYSNLILNGVEICRRALDDDDIIIKAVVSKVTVYDISDAKVGDQLQQYTGNGYGTIVAINGNDIYLSSDNGIPFDAVNYIVDSTQSYYFTPPSAVVLLNTFNAAYPQSADHAYTILIDGAGKTVSRVYHYIKHFSERGSSGHAPVTTAAKKREFYLNRYEDSAYAITQTDGQFYFRAFTNFDVPLNSYSDQAKASPLAVQIGDELHAGQGIFLQNFAVADVNNIVAKDSLRIPQAPLGRISMGVSNLPIGAHVEIVEDSGMGRDTAQYTLAAANNRANATVIFAANLPSDVPTGGDDNEIIVKMVDTSSTSPENKVLRYRGVSKNNATVTLATAVTGTATAVGTGFRLIDTGAFSSSSTIQVGDVILNVTDGSYCWIKEIVDANTVRTTQLEGGTDNIWQSGDSWKTNVLALNYASATDTAWIPYMDRIATSENEVVTLDRAARRNVIINVRHTSQRDFHSTSVLDESSFVVPNTRIREPQYLAESS